VRRNEELRLLYEKIKIQQSTLQRGQAQYRDRLNEIRVLKIKVGERVWARRAWWGGAVRGGIGVGVKDAWVWLCL